MNLHKRFWPRSVSDYVHLHFTHCKQTQQDKAKPSIWDKTETNKQTNKQTKHKKAVKTNKLDGRTKLMTNETKGYTNLNFAMPIKNKKQLKENEETQLHNNKIKK